MHWCVPFAGVLLSPAAFAVDNATQAPRFADPATAPGGFAQLSQVSLALLAVLLAVFVIAWLLRRARLLPAHAPGNLQLLQAVALGAKERAVLIKVQQRRLLLGVAPGSVTLLLELEPETSGTEAEAGSPANPAPDFKSLLRRSMGLQ